MIHEFYIKKTFSLAKKGVGLVTPNPLVGTVIVKDGQIISTGFHAQCGLEHAELAAINNAKKSIVGATLYTNLEPCCHVNKKTPPCVQRIINEKISRVVISNKDPNLYVNGKGITFLREAGIEVIENILEEEGELLNEVFFTNQRKKRPFIHLKYAQTLDGNIACLSGDSKWITHEKARKKAHALRSHYDATLIGVGTFTKDDPELTIRLVKSKKKSPFRIVMGSLEYVQESYKLICDKYKQKTIWVTSHDDYGLNPHKVELLKKNNIQILCVTAKNGYLDIPEVCARLFSLNIMSVLIEGGSKIITSFIKQKLYDRISVFIAPKIIGTGTHAIGDLDITVMANALLYEDIFYTVIDDVVYLCAKPQQLQGL